MSKALESLLTSLFGRRDRSLAGPVTVPSSNPDPSSKVEASDASKGGLSFALRFISKDKPALVATAIISVFLVYAVAEGAMQEYATLVRHPAIGYILSGNPSPNVAVSKLHLHPPSFSSIFLLLGTNDNGQSISAMILYAAPHDAFAVLTVVLSGVGIGMLVGLPAGYFGGWADEALMRVTDAFLAFPFLVLAIVFSALFGFTGGIFSNKFTEVLVVLYLLFWPTYARYFRGQTLALKNRGFVEASKLSGIGSFRIIFRHIFPNAIDPIIAQATLDLGTVLVTYSTLAFLGLLQFGYPEWGAMTDLGIPFFPSAWWMMIFPAAVIVIIVACFSMIGDRVQDLVGGRVTY